ncbi:MAG: histone deacetylase [Gemmatimonadetes bacterium]|nr:histone deacetylase [Gemmatimonadota bacterium]
MHLHVVWHPSSLDHDPGPGHPERPERLRAILEELRTPPLAQTIVWHDAAPAPEAALTRVHPLSYLARLEAIAAAGGGRLDLDTVMSPKSFEAARYAAGAAMAAARLALDGQPAFAPVRPPGHHALAEEAMGFCLINNVVVAARTALEEWGCRRVLIVDWDVHHGNGTQALVEQDSRIRYVSLHQWPLYPGTGRADERGVGNVFNLPRPPGLPRARYLDDLDQAVRSATGGWTPDLVLISAGFDAMAGDPLAGFTLEPEDYGTWIGRWRRIGAPIASVLEGGYVPERIRKGVAAHLTALSSAFPASRFTSAPVSRET